MMSQRGRLTFENVGVRIVTIAILALALLGPAPPAAADPAPKPRLGVQIQDLTKELATSLGSALTEGALVVEVIADSPAAAAGLKSGDIIVEFAKSPVRAAKDLPELVGKTRVNDVVGLKVYRNGSPFFMALTVGAAPAGGATAQAAAAPQSGPRQWQFPPAAASNPTGIAVIIGNRNYSQAGNGVPDVDFAIDDARAVRQYVLTTLGFREGNILYLENASNTQLVTTFGNRASPQGKLFDWVRPGVSDVFVYYAGHGAPSLQTGNGYLLAIDADPQRVELAGYPLETLYANLGKLPARSVTVMLDACFSGDSNSGTLVKSASSIALRVAEPEPRLAKATILTAAAASEVASWDTVAGHGLFTRYFLDGVSGEADRDPFGNGDGRVTLGEMKAFLESEVTYQARRNFGRDQHPRIQGDLTRPLAGVR